MNIAYRKDIDGLRALAVLSVIVFHANKTWLSGGFLGVDIFFVISGYLITRLLMTEIHARGSISLSGFYERRAKRIMPALVTVIVCTLIAGFFLLTPPDIMELASSIRWSLLFLPNIFFYFNVKTDYFADNSSEIPLLHLWSLGAEEQFYVIWPAIILIIIRTISLKIAQGVIVCSLLLLSLLLAQYTLASNDQFAYYMLPTRAWELMAGAILVWLPRDNFRPIISEAIAATGLLAIVASFVMLTPTDPIPGIAAVPAIVGTSLLLWINSNTVTHRLLASKPAVAVGLVSYSAYLWHWPILAYIHYSEGIVTTQAACGAISVTLLLACLTYRWIEKPARKRTSSKLNSYLLYLIAPVAVLTWACALLQQGITNKSLTFIDWINYDDVAKKEELWTRDPDKYAFNCGKGHRFKPELYQKPACTYPEGNTPDAILVGDSNAKHYLGALRIFADQYNFTFQNLTQSSCSLILDEKPLPWVQAKYAKGCTDYLDFLAPRLGNYNTVIIGGSWTDYDQHPMPIGTPVNDTFRSRFEQTIQQLSTSGKHVIILGKIPFFTNYNPHCLTRQIQMPWLHCEQRYSAVITDPPINQFMRTLQAKYSNVSYFDFNAVLCEPARIHKTFIKPDNFNASSICSPFFSGLPVYADRGHLSLSGAEKLATSLLSKQDPATSVFSTLGQATQQNPNNSHQTRQ